MEKTAPEPHRILIVSSEQDIRSLVGTYIRNILGPVLITEVETGEKAVEVAQMHANLLMPFKLLITDLGLGSGNGLVVVTGLERLGVRVPILIMTGHSKMEVTNPPSGNLKGYLRKPFDQTQLKEMLLLVLGITN